MTRIAINVGVAMAVVVMLALAQGCGYQQAPAPAKPTVDLAAEEKAIRAEATAWGVALKAKDLDKTLSYYAAESCILPDRGARVSTPEERRKLWAGVFKEPVELASIETTDVTISHHGDLAYEAGKFTQSMKVKKGKTTTASGKYLVVWKKQADEKWKAVADIWNMDD